MADPIPRCAGNKDPMIYVMKDRSIISCDDKLDAGDQLRFSNGAVCDMKEKLRFVNAVKTELGNQPLQGVSLPVIANYFSGVMQADSLRIQSDFGGALRNVRLAGDVLKGANLLSAVMKTSLGNLVKRVGSDLYREANRAKNAQPANANDIWKVLYAFGPDCSGMADLDQFVQDGYIDKAAVDAVKGLQQPLITKGIGAAIALADKLLKDSNATDKDRADAYVALKGISEMADKAKIKFDQKKANAYLQQLDDAIPKSSPERLRIPAPATTQTP
ncbi:MAG: hypothetical protein WC956_03920 [bacterium]